MAFHIAHHRATKLPRHFSALYQFYRVNGLSEVVSSDLEEKAVADRNSSKDQRPVRRPLERQCGR
jgi:hypothetical protein